jgi:hypothetical protein
MNADQKHPVTLKADHLLVFKHQGWSNLSPPDRDAFKATIVSMIGARPFCVIDAADGVDLFSTPAPAPRRTGPEVGDVVLYTNLGDKDGKFPPTIQAALVTGTYSDPDVVGSMIADLHIFYRTGQFDMVAVKFSETPARGRWHWKAP